MTCTYVGRFRIAVSSMILPAVAMGVFALGVLPISKAPSSVLADSWDQATKVTFSQPVEVPGQVLPAGTYWFKLLNSPTSRNIVQVYNASQSQQIALLMAVPDYRTRPTGKTVITFEERASNSPPAIKAWFYPGDNYGQAFVYTRSRARELAKRTNQPVLSIPDSEDADMKKSASSNTSAAKGMRQSDLKAQQPSGQEVDGSTVVSTPPQISSK